ncbi:hypothetical protein CP03DC35_0712B, partial [Chlamydia psittaci 03DC35]
YLRI